MPTTCSRCASTAATATGRPFGKRSPKPARRQTRTDQPHHENPPPDRITLDRTRGKPHRREPPRNMLDIATSYPPALGSGPLSKLGRRGRLEQALDLVHQRMLAAHGPIIGKIRFDGVLPVSAGRRHFLAAMRQILAPRLI